MNNNADSFAKIRRNPEILLGTVFLDKYKLTRFLGAGGWNTVYEGIPVLEPNHPVAVKIPHGLLENQDMSRFRREAKVLSGLVHPNTVALIDFGVGENGRPYLVTELAPGITLEAALATTTLPVEQTIAIFDQVCDVLYHAHALGFIHRDLKPSNVMVTGLDDPVPGVKVIDFGAIKLIGQEASVITKKGETLGTPSYMSPEQCMANPVDARSDIYSIGSMLYEALTGRVPFTGKTHVEIMQKQVVVEAPAFTEEERTRIPAHLEVAVKRCLQKSPANRFATALQLREALMMPEAKTQNVAQKLLSAFKEKWGMR